MPTAALGHTLEGARESECSSCHYPIVWSYMDESGKRNPLDRTSVAEGLMVVCAWQADAPHDEPTMAPVVRVLKGDERESYTGARYTSHFATCPNADQHRKSP